MKLLHAADFHLDSPLRHLDTRQALERRREMRELPKALIALAQQEQADLILLPGDLFDGQRVHPETVEALIAALGSTDIPVVIAPGNHDYVDSASPYLTANWPKNVSIFTESRVSSFEFPRLNCVVHGYAFTSAHRADEPLSCFSTPDDGKLHLLCAHGDVAAGSRYAPISPGALAQSNLAYAALGHIHTCSGINRIGDTAWAYCGCPEGRGFDEIGPKGALVVTLDDNGIRGNFHQLCRRQYRIEQVEVSQFGAFLSALAQDDLVRIILTGESDTPPDLAALTQKAQARLFYAEVQDETTLTQSLWARSEEESLTGLFLREMRSKLDSALPEDRPHILLATRFGLAALEGREDLRP